MTIAAAPLGLRGQVRVSVRNKHGRIVSRRLFKNIETQYGLNSLAMWLAGGGGVLAPAAPSWIALGTLPANLLSAAQADFETLPLGWQALSNCAVAQSASQAWNGADSLALTASSAATMSATSTPGTGAIAATVGTVYFAAAHFRANSATRNVSVNIAWYDSSGTLLSTSSGTPVADTNSGWTRAYVVATAPASTAFAAVQTQVASAGNGEIHYVDGAQLAAAWDSAPFAWTAGGQASIPAVGDTALYQERQGTRRQISTGYTQAALAVLLATYQQADPVGTFTEAGLFDAGTTTATIGADASAGDTTLTLTGSTPAVPAGQQIWIPPSLTGTVTNPGEYTTVKTAAVANATTWTLTDALLRPHPHLTTVGTSSVSATATVFTGNLWGHVLLTNVSKVGTQLLTVQWEIQLVNG